MSSWCQWQSALDTTGFKARSINPLKWDKTKKKKLFPGKTHRHCPDSKGRSLAQLHEGPGPGTGNASGLKPLVLLSFCPNSFWPQACQQLPSSPSVSSLSASLLLFLISCFPLSRPASFTLSTWQKMISLKLKSWSSHWPELLVQTQNPDQGKSVTTSFNFARERCWLAQFALGDCVWSNQG